jgi:hypothetical protein
MKRTTCLLPLLLAVLFAAAQSNIRLSNNWIDTYYLNPASVDPYYSTIKVNLGGRHQWVQLPGAPTTETFTLAFFSSAWKSQFGIRGIFDQIGYTKTTDIGPTYTFVLNLDPNTDHYCKLNLGLGARYQRLHYDHSQAIFETTAAITATDPALNHIQDPDQQLNWDLGFELAFGNYRLDRGGNFLTGIALQNFGTLFANTPAQEMMPFANTNFIYAQYHSKILNPNSNNSHAYLFGLSVMQTKSKYAPDTYTGNIFQWESHVKIRYYSNRNRFISGGILFRTKKEYKTLRDWGILLEYDWKRYFTTSLVYENNFSSIGRSSGTWGTFELIFIWRLNPNKERYRMTKKSFEFSKCIQYYDPFTYW